MAPQSLVLRSLKVFVQPYAEVKEVGWGIYCLVTRTVLSLRGRVLPEKLPLVTHDDSDPAPRQGTCRGVLSVGNANSPIQGCWAKKG